MSQPLTDGRTTTLVVVPCLALRLVVDPIEETIIHNKMNTETSAGRQNFLGTGEAQRLGPPAQKRCSKRSRAPASFGFPSIQPMQKGPALHTRQWLSSADGMRLRAAAKSLPPGPWKTHVRRSDSAAARPTILEDFAEGAGRSGTRARLHSRHRTAPEACKSTAHWHGRLSGACAPTWGRRRRMRAGST